MKQFVRVMKAMSDPNRIRIIKILQEKELCVCELTELLGLAQSTVSKHLRLLDDAGLTDFRREGAWMIYRIHDNPGSPYARMILERIIEWHNDDPLLCRMLDQAAVVDRVRVMAA